MKTILYVFLLAAFAALAQAADASGKWTGTFTAEGSDHTEGGVVILKQTGAEITGSAGPSDEEQMPISNGKIDGDRITFDVNGPDGLMLKISLVLEGDSLKGDVAGSHGGEAMKAKLDLKRVKA